MFEIKLASPCIVQGLMIDYSGFGFQTVFSSVVDQHFWLQACMPFGKGDLIVVIIEDLQYCTEKQDFRQRET